MTKKLSLLAILAGSVLITAFLATAAHATFTGTNGKIAFTSNRSGHYYEIWTMNPNGGGLAQLTTDPADNLGPVWSPDRRKIVFGSDRDGNFEIYVMDANGKHQKRLTNNPADDGDPSWSPDGKKIVFRSDRTGTYEIYEMNANGSDQTQLTFLPGFNEGPEYSPDGRLILFTHAADDGTNGPVSLWTMHAGGKDPTQLTSDSLQAGFADWSPDGHKIVFSNNDCGTCPPSDIYTIDARGKHLHQLTAKFGNSLGAKWSPDGKQIVFTNNPPTDFEHEQIYTMKADGRNRGEPDKRHLRQLRPQLGLVPLTEATAREHLAGSSIRGSSGTLAHPRAISPGQVRGEGRLSSPASGSSFSGSSAVNDTLRLSGSRLSMRNTPAETSSTVTAQPGRSSATPPNGRTKLAE